jgi:UDP-N-acetylmuramoyl-L-alanyl-D-glutamate--2,6-diaminopimelate ligase
MNQLTTAYLALKAEGKLIGEDIVITGAFNILKDARKGDVIVRHWINETGVKLASEKKASCIVTQDARGQSIKIAEKLNLPLILVNKIELVNSFAIKWTINRYAPNSKRIVVTGTNGKSTTTHMINSILQEAGYNSHTNTDSESEFNTLIDPMVAKQISDLNFSPDYLVFEVSEVQGWEDRKMVGHAHIMTSSIEPQVVVLTNVALDHIGLVNSLEEASEEISGVLNGFEGNFVILNHDDSLIRKMSKKVPDNVKTFFYGKDAEIQLKNDGIYQNEKLIIPKHYLPFKSPHFIQNTLAAVATATALQIKPEIIKRAVSKYTPLNRRFSILKKEPLIIDDFAHNPDGIKATIKSTVELNSGEFYIVCAIRGSRGNSINKLNAEAVAESLKTVRCNLIVTSSQDVVDDANWVKPPEKKVFIDVLQNEGINYTYYKTLVGALKNVLKSAKHNDTILLIGAQGMDPASDVLKDLKII